MRKWVLGICLLVLFIFRLWLAVGTKHGDMYNNWDWGLVAAKYGLSTFYELPKSVFDHSRPNQPPGSVLVNALSYQIYTGVSSTLDFFNTRFAIFPSRSVWWWQLHGQLVSLKLPSIVSDFFIFAAILYLAAIFNRSHLGIIVGLIYLVNPALWFNSAWWGQTDSVVAALTIWSLVLLVKGRVYPSALLLGISFITKASWAPIFPFWLIYLLKNYPTRWQSIFIMPLSAILLALPFHPALDLPYWLSNLYIQRFLPGESGFITVNAFNFWNLFYTSNFIPDSTTVAGIPVSLISLAILALVFLVLLIRFWRRISPRAFLYYSLLFMFAFFLFASRMHERYFYPVFPLLSLLLVVSGNFLLSSVYVITSIAYLANLYHDWWSPYNTWVVSLYTSWLIKSISAAYLVAFTLAFRLKLTHAAKN
jgi:Gpi18-like mannosyltransferase